MVIMNMKRIILLLSICFSAAIHATEPVGNNLDLFLCIGQSNMAGRGTLDGSKGDFEPMENVYILDTEGNMVTPRRAVCRQGPQACIWEMRLREEPSDAVIVKSKEAARCLFFCKNKEDKRRAPELPHGNEDARRAV